MNTFRVYSFQYHSLASFIATFKSWSVQEGLIYFTEEIVHFLQDTVDIECMVSRDSSNNSNRREKMEVSLAEKFTYLNLSINHYVICNNNKTSYDFMGTVSKKLHLFALSRSRNVVVML